MITSSNATIDAPVRANPVPARHGGDHSWRADADVPAFDDSHPLIVFDGDCVLCSRSMQVVLNHDRHKRFRLTTAQGPLGAALYRHFGLAAGEPGTILLVADGRLLTESGAAIAIIAGLGGAWRAATALRLVPRVLRDPVYRLVARNRYRWFGRRQACWLPTPDIADRIL